MTTPKETLPAYQSKTEPAPFCGYDGRVKAYGDAPAGYRWLKVGEKTPNEAIYANHHEEKWVKRIYADTVKDTHYAFAAPITPELIPSDPLAAVALEVVRRNTKVVRFKIARQSSGIKYDTEFKASNGILIASLLWPEILYNVLYPEGKLYLRGKDKPKDDNILSCTPKRFERIVAALAEYNASLTAKAEVKPVPAPAPVSSEPPKYTGPRIGYEHDLEKGIRAAGPAPEGWRYLDLGEKIKIGDFVLRFHEWTAAIDFRVVVGWYWPVIRRVEPCSPPKSPEAIIADLQKEIAALKAKVAEQAKALAEIKKIAS